MLEDNIKESSRSLDASRLNLSAFPTITYTFYDGLMTSPSQHSGYIRFCVQLHPDTDLKTADLSISNPYTEFDNIPYPITNFIDNRECGKGRNGLNCFRRISDCKCSKKQVISVVSKR